MDEHEIIERKKIENIYVETDNKLIKGDEIKTLYYLKKEQTEYYQFRCIKLHKTVSLEINDFTYCPFCGKEVNDLFSKERRNK